MLYFLATTTALAPVTATAHPEVTPTAVNRYLTVAALDTQVEISMALLFGALPAGEERRRMDGDGDGRLSAAEKKDAQRHWKIHAAPMFIAQIDGAKPAGPPTIDINLGDSDRVAADPLVIQATLRATVERRPIAIVLGPGEPPPRAGETEVAIAVGPDWRLDYSRQGQGPQSTQSMFKAADALAANAMDPVVFAITPAIPSPGQNQGTTPGVWVTVLVGAPAVAALTWLAWLVRHRRRRSRRQGKARR